MSSPDDGPEEEPTANEKFIFEQVKDRYNAENTRSQNMTVKASNLVGWVGLIISVVLAGGGVLFTSNNDGAIPLDLLDIALLGVLLSALVGSIFVALFAVRVSGQDTVPDSRSLIESYGESPHRTTLRALTVEFTFATENNIKRNKIKARQVTASWILFLTGMGLTAIFIIMQFTKLIANG